MTSLLFPPNAADIVVASPGPVNPLYFLRRKPSSGSLEALKKELVPPPTAVAAADDNDDEALTKAETEEREAARWS